MTRQHHPILCRVLVHLLVWAQVLLAVPVSASGGEKPKAAKESEPKPKAPPPPPPGKVNRTLPEVSPPPQVPRFTDEPTDLEISQARVFEEPLVAIGGATSAAENTALAVALMSYLGAGDTENTNAVEAFLMHYPTSAWRASLLTGLGMVYRHNGYISKALAAWEEAWRLSKDETEPRRRALSDRALSEYAELAARLGRFDTLEALFTEVGERNVRGSAAEKLTGAKRGLWVMEHQPERAFLCGPMGLDRILATTRPDYALDPKIRDARSTNKGTSLSQMRALAHAVGLELQMARRGKDTRVLIPALVHWKAGHFAALVRQAGGRYLVQDPTLGDEIWVSRAALDEEASGYFLVPAGKLPEGWLAVTEADGAQIWGKGYAWGSDGQGIKPTDVKVCQQCQSQPPMAVHAVHAMLVSLNITDTPVRYSPPLGPSVQFQVTYNQRDLFQPSAFTYSNLGPKWTFDWLSYVTDDPANPSNPVTVYVRGGGQETYTGFDGTSYAPHPDSNAVVVRTWTLPITYERRLPDGGIEVFSQANGQSTFPRKVFLTRSIDAQGNALSFTYDASLRLVAVTDASGQVTTVSYELGADPLKITKVTDPFGRFAAFEYNAAGQLRAITDPIGIRSEFTYVSGDMIDSLTTPYGTTTFRAGENGADRWLEVTDPVGGKERVEFHVQTVALPMSDPVGPAGFTNDYLQYRNTFYWDKRAMALAPGDVTKARLLHWAHVRNNTSLMSGTIENEKKPLEGKVWYAYPGQLGGTNVEGTQNHPSKIARILDDGSTQLYQFGYNAIGKVIRSTDPLGRETVNVYGNNNTPDPDPVNGTGLDLLQVKRKNASGGYDTVASYTYNAQHQQLTATDATGATTSYSYDSQGRLLTVTTPPPAGLTTGPTTTYTYDPATGQVQSIGGPVANAVQSFAYDGYGRLRTATDTDNLTLTYDYDALDRVTKVSYPDGTYEQTVYNRLDAQDRRDRLGRWTHAFHDALRRAVAVQDANRATTTYQWCTCGSLDKLVDAGQNATTWDRDLQGRVTKETRADSSFTQFIYENATSRLRQMTDRRGITTTFAYALDNQPLSKSYSDANTHAVTYAYDTATGVPTSVDNGTEALSWTYDTDDRIASEGSSANSSVVAYTYDPAGNRTSVSLNGTALVSYTHDVTSRLKTITRGTNSFSFGYDTASRRSSLSYPNGITTAYEYDSESRLRSLGASLGTTPITQFSYQYDAVGNRTQKGTLDLTESYLYDAKDQLAHAQRNAGSPSQWDWGYDAVGNRTRSQVDGALLGATYNNVNELVSTQVGGGMTFRGTVNEPATVAVGGNPAQVDASGSFAGQVSVPSGSSSVVVTAKDASGNTRTNTYQVSPSGSAGTYGYDASGDLTSKTDASGSWSYVYDAEHRLTQVLLNGSQVAIFAYDPLGRRIRKTAGGVVTSYTYDGQSILQQSATGAVTVTYVQGPGIDEPLAADDGTSLSYFHADALGSAAKTTSATGAVTMTRQYDTWGNLQAGASAAGYAFTGREWDPETGLYYYRARYYDPKLGRFLSEDPLGFLAGPNLYSYVNSNPTTYTDPWGLIGESDMKSFRHDFPKGPLAPDPSGMDVAVSLALAAVALPALAGVALETEEAAAAAAVARAAAAAVRRALAKLKDICCIVDIHPPHHRFKIMGGKRCWHLSITCYKKGVPGSDIRLQIPIPGTCS